LPNDVKSSGPTRRTQRQIEPTHLQHYLASRFLPISQWLLSIAYEFSAASQLFILRSVSQQAEVSNPHEAVGQDVQQEAPNELRGF
jgi:hypothetical protein